MKTEKTIFWGLLTVVLFSLGQAAMAQTLTDVYLDDDKFVVRGSGLGCGSLGVVNNKGEEGSCFLENGEGMWVCYILTEPDAAYETSTRQRIHALRVEVTENMVRHTPFHKKYRPQFYFETTDVTGVVETRDWLYYFVTSFVVDPEHGWMISFEGRNPLTESTITTVEPEQGDSIKAPNNDTFSINCS